MQKHRIRNRLAAALAAVCVSGVPAFAGSVTYDFNTDPTGILQFYGSATWVSFDGSGTGDTSTNGFLQLTQNANSQGAAIVFNDFDNGQVVQGFTFSCDLRIGNGTSSPADGLSIDYVRASDPLLSATDPSQTGGWTLGPGGGQGPEEGSTTGIAICMDAYNNGTGDTIGFSVVVDGQTIATYPVPTLNGACDDPTSLQTGPIDPNDLSEAPLCWQPLQVSLDANGIVTITWKGTAITPAGGLHTTFIPSPGRLVLGSRTGGANEYHEVDNIKLTTIAASVALVGNVTGLPDGFAITLNDSGSSVVNTNQITLQLNGTAVTPTLITKTGGATTVNFHGYPNLLALGATNTVVITAKDVNNNTITGTRTFTTPFYSQLSAADAIPAASINTSASGFRIRPWQSGAQPNSLYWTEEQLAGLHGTNDADLSSATDNGYIDYPGVINFNIDSASAGAGNFTPDDVTPGIPSLTGLTGSASLEALTYLYFPAAGLYTMGVNSDDGFKVTAGNDPQDRFSPSLGEFNGGRGPTDTLFSVAVPQAGYYPFRLIWENGNGELPGNGAAVEWFTVAADGTKVLINDPSNPQAIKAYYGGPALPARVSQVVPYAGQTGARPDNVLLQLTDGGTQVNASSIQLSINGKAATLTTGKTGTVTTAKATLTGSNLLPAGTNTATLTWSDSGSPARSHTNTWSFVTMNYVTLNPALKRGNVDTTQPGFTLRVNQIDPSLAGDSGDVTANNIESAESQLAGLYSPAFGDNVADTSSAATNNVWYLNDPINYLLSGTAFGNFDNDLPLPGVPGTTGITDMVAADFVGYADLQPGFYEMGVNSDDDFRLLEATNVSRQVLHIDGGSIHQDIHAVMTSTNNSNYGGSIPTTPITAPLVYVDAASCPNVPNLTGKIALVDLHRCSDAQSDINLAYQMQTNGAVAVVIANVPSFGLAYIGSGTLPGNAQVTIPVLLTSAFNGAADVLKTNANLTASIGADTNLVLGEYNGNGRGPTDTIFGFVVPSAGAYPFRLVYENGNGGAAVEWFTVTNSVTVDGQKTLVNDRSTPGSLLLYRSASAPVTGGTFNAPTVAADGKVTISWTGSGTLQQTTDLVNWTDVTPQPSGNTYTVSPTAASHAFYRLR